MKKLIITGGFLAMVWGFSCSGDSEEELFDVPDCAVPVSLSADIMPLLQSNCAIEGCHAAGSGLPDFMDKETVLDYADEVKRRTREGAMPPPYSGIVLTSEEINQITCWVDQCCGKRELAVPSLGLFSPGGIKKNLHSHRYADFFRFARNKNRFAILECY